MKSSNFFIAGSVALAAIALVLLKLLGTSEAVADSQPTSGSLTSPSSQAQTEPLLVDGSEEEIGTLDRQDVKGSDVPFLDRWRALVADEELRRRIDGPGEIQRQKLIDANRPSPFAIALEALRNRGAVPPPNEEVLLELGWSEIQTGANLLQLQADYLQQLEGKSLEQMPARLFDDIKVQPLDYPPELIALFLTRGRSAEELATNLPLLIALQEARTSSLVAYCYLWDEYQFYFFCAMTAAREGQIELPTHTKREYLASMIPEYADLLTRIEGAQNSYLQGILAALQPFYPEAGF